ncbi:CotO family spore coat protein [Neobacillus mesonae]|uniref:CotO family spore coat protein n=1 Tax=Neobacillus mesonae TaxID=1193713 RepID=UPI0020415DBC|nr:CotO family spore coat protein [Neobacillus mesonae]MCM3569972.1 spore coat CotO family protein [Neobacillus mesonae]
MPKKKIRGPLLFINQTFQRTPLNSNMQEVYTYKPGGNEHLEEEKGIEEKTIKPLKNIDQFEEPIPIELERFEDTQTEAVLQQKETKHPALKRVKPFNEMNISERIDYLLNIPKVLPPIPCVFYTAANRNYQGYLTDYEDNEVTIQFHNKTTKTIPVDEIQNIIMIGLKR